MSDAEVLLCHDVSRDGAAGINRAREGVDAILNGAHSNLAFFLGASAPSGAPDIFDNAC